MSTVTALAALASIAVPATASAIRPGEIAESRVSDNGLNRVTLGPDGKLWFTECGATSSIGRVSSSDVGKPNPAVDHFATAAGSCPIDITTGPDGALWFTEFAGNIGRITTDGQLTEFPVAGAPHLFGITKGPGDALWFVANCCGDANGNIGRITTNGQVSLFPVLRGTSPAPGITTGPDGNLWFGATNIPRAFLGFGIDRILGFIQRMTPRGQVSGLFLIPTRYSDPSRIVTGPDGNLWFTEYAYEVRGKPGVRHGGNKIGRITTTGQITEVPIPTPYARADGITSGPDGVYFTESPQNGAYGAIGRVQP